MARMQRTMAFGLPYFCLKAWTPMPLRSPRQAWAAARSAARWCRTQCWYACGAPYFCWKAGLPVCLRS